MRNNYGRNLNVLLRISGLILCGVLLVGGGIQGATTAKAQEGLCTEAHLDVSTPLNDLGSQTYIRMDGQNTGVTGGLYPHGSNVRPPEHEAAGIQIASQITPLDSTGAPDPIFGAIVMVSIGMSNTSAEFREYISLAEDDPDINPNLIFVNGAQPGQVSSAWVDPDSQPWQELDRRLGNQGVTPHQVQVAWVKQAQSGAGGFPDKALSLLDDLTSIVQNLKTNYPNIKMAYISSRTRSYSYWNGLSPEPTAFETGFSVKWVIENQINSDPDLNYDPSQGVVKAPYLSWGAYLWIDGVNPRSDGMIWRPEDLAPDCTHPSSDGRQKAAQMLLDFFKSDTTTGWFTRSRTDHYKFYLPLISFE